MHILYNLIFDFDRLPFNWKTPFGYLVAFVSQYLGSTFVLTIFTVVMNLVYETCWFFITVARDIRKELTEFNADVRTSHENPEKMTKRFVELIQIFSDAKQ